MGCVGRGFRERKISPKFFRPKFFHGCPRGISLPKCFFFQDLEGLTEVFGRMSAGISAPKLPLWADFSFLKFERNCRGFFGSQFVRGSALFFPALLQKLVCDYFSICCREIWWEIRREFCRIFSDPQNKGSKASGKIFGAFFSQENW